MISTTRPALTKQRLAREVGRRTRLTNRQAESALEAAITVISEHLADGGRVELTNFLTMEVKPRTRLASGNAFWHTSSPSNADPMTIYVLRCRPGKRLRMALRTLSFSVSHNE